MVVAAAAASIFDILSVVCVKEKVYTFAISIPINNYYRTDEGYLDGNLSKNRNERNHNATRQNFLANKKKAACIDIEMNVMIYTEIFEVASNEEDEITEEEMQTAKPHTDEKQKK